MIAFRFSRLLRLVPALALGLVSFAAGRQEDLAARAKSAFGPLPPTIASDKNPITPEKTKLGKMLFYESRISADGTVSCSRCHPFSLRCGRATDIDRGSVEGQREERADGSQRRRPDRRALGRKPDGCRGPSEAVGARPFVFRDADERLRGGKAEIHSRLRPAFQGGLSGRRGPHNP